MNLTSKDGTSPDEIQIKILFGKSSNFVSSNYALLHMSLLTYGNKYDAILIEQAIEK